MTKRGWSSCVTRIWRLPAVLRCAFCSTSPPATGILLGLAGLAALAGWRPGHWARIVIACCIAVLVAINLKDQLKYAFGRTWPETWVNDNPSWIGNGTYGFWPFHKGAGWASFPSGHMTDRKSTRL